MMMDPPRRQKIVKRDQMTPTTNRGGVVTPKRVAPSPTITTSPATNSTTSHHVNNNVGVLVGGASVVTFPEFDAAANWWKSQLKMSLCDEDALKKFETFLKSNIHTKLAQHWFPECPLKGQAFRSISLDRIGRLDPILRSACVEANIQNIFDFFPYVDSIVMWIDPGEVAVKTFWRYAKGGSEEIVYKNSLNHSALLTASGSSSISRGTSSSSPSSSSISSSCSVSPSSSSSTSSSTSTSPVTRTPKASPPRTRQTDPNNNNPTSGATTTATPSRFVNVKQFNIGSPYYKSLLVSGGGGCVSVTPPSPTAVIPIIPPYHQHHHHVVGVGRGIWGNSSVVDWDSPTPSVQA